jgi:hypothetical protein
MTKASGKPLPTTAYERFRDNLEQESPRAAFWLYAMQYGIMAQTGLDEPAALELACKIVAGPQQPPSPRSRLNRA